MTAPPLETGSRARGKGPAKRARGFGPIIALEPIEPSRNGLGRLRQALQERGALRHPNLLRTRIMGEAEGRIFVAFEPRPHRGSRALPAAAPLEPAEAARVLDGAAAGLEALRRRGLSATDLTPDAVLVHPVEGAVLMHLGVPREVLRRPPEADSERASGMARPTHAEADGVYSLGRILYTALTGIDPDGSKSAGPHRSGEPPRPSDFRPALSSEVDGVVTRALARDPTARFSDAAALSRAFSEAVGITPKVARARVAPERERPTPRRASRPAESAGTARRPAEPRRRRAQGGEEVTSGPAIAGRARPPVSGALQSRPARIASVGAVLRSSRSRRVLLATGLVGASALVGITLGQANEPDRSPSSITRAGLTIQLPPGWQEGDLDPGRPALSSPIAATAPGETTAGLVVGKLSSVAAAGRALGQAEAGAGTGAGTRVRLGEVDAWRYRGLSPRPGLTGTGYVVPTAGGAVLMLCHASNATPRVRLTECERAASTLVVRGEQPSVDLWRTRLDEVIAELRSRRSEGRRALARAERAAGQAQAASALARSYQGAARSVESISLPEPAASLASLSAALREVADSYEHLARAARARRGTAYRDAGDAVARSEAEVEVELARAGRS